MVDLSKYQAHKCFIAAGLVVHDCQVLLVKHKKLGIWLAPGGHIDDWELPHQAAEREVFEETGIHAETVSVTDCIESDESQYLPNPIAMSLHWVSKDNFTHRITSTNPNLLHRTTLWPRGCEQHLGYLYLMRPTQGIEVTLNEEESTDIGWFKKSQIDALETWRDIKAEIYLAFHVASTSSN